MENVDDLQENEISELLHTLGTILRESINGLMTILRGRSELKSQLRVVMTTFKATENNPLKFSPSAEMVLKTFLIDRNPGFLDAVEAIREGFEDIKNHELAVNAGTGLTSFPVLVGMLRSCFSIHMPDLAWPGLLRKLDRQDSSYRE